MVLVFLKIGAVVEQTRNLLEFVQVRSLICSALLSPRSGAFKIVAVLDQLGSQRVLLPFFPGVGG